MRPPRRRIRNVQVNRRYGALCARERAVVQQYLRAAVAVGVATQRTSCEAQRTRLKLVLAMLLLVVCMASRDNTRILIHIRQQPKTIADVEPHAAWTNFRCRKDDMGRLMQALRIPAIWQCANRSTFHGETAFLLLLRRFT